LQNLFIVNQTENFRSLAFSRSSQKIQMKTNESYLIP
jgi:hypothetical protein